MAEKHIVCQGATVYCSQSVACNSPATAIPLTITSQTLVEANEGKICATNNDKTVVNMNFGICNVPGTTKPPCNAMVTWNKVFEDAYVTEAGLKLLTEKSEGLCTACGVPGTIKVAYHGQVTTVVPETMANSSPDLMEAVNPLTPTRSTAPKKINLKINKIETKSFVPLGIENYQKKNDNSADKIKIKFEIKYQAAKEYTIQVYDKDSTLIWQEIFLQGIIIKTNSGEGNSLIFDEPQENNEEIYPIGGYTYEWDGFDAEGIYDSKRMSKELTFKITAKSNDDNESSDEKKIKTKQEVKWVDVLIDKNTKNIDVTLRVNLKDGGEKGLNPGYIEYKSARYGEQMEVYHQADWEKVPPDVIKNNGNTPPLQKRTKTFEELVQLAKEGINHYWSRNSSKRYGTDVKIDNESYQVYVKTENSEVNCTDHINLVFLTNYDSASNFNRSSNPGTIRDFATLVVNVVPQQIFYAVGYNYYKNAKGLWNYIDYTAADIKYKYTSAHEFGHEILSAFGGGEHSVEHKGTSTFWLQERIPSKKSTLPKSGEVDLMIYYDDDDFNRTTAAAEDVLGLLWLVKTKIK